MLYKLFYRNPWSCNKLTYDLQIYLTRKSIEYHTVCAKMSGPKKFEKMIMYNPQIKYERQRPSIAWNVKKNTTTTRKSFASTLAPNSNTNVCVNATEETDITKTLNAISPYWFFLSGFLLGSACSIFIYYVWFTWGISCCRGYSERRRNNDIQRVSLLQNLWQYEDSVFESAHRTASCPGTPPPPYREVMLRPGIYRSPSVAAN